MIQLTKLNGDFLYINPHLIERIESKPDSIITMNSQMQYVIRENIEQITDKIIAYRTKLGFSSQE